LLFLCGFLSDYPDTTHQFVHLTGVRCAWIWLWETTSDRENSKRS